MNTWKLPNGHLPGIFLCVFFCLRWCTGNGSLISNRLKKTGENYMKRYAMTTTSDQQIWLNFLLNLKSFIKRTLVCLLTLICFSRWGSEIKQVGYPWESTRDTNQWLYRAIWGNIWGTTARVPSQEYPKFPFSLKQLFQRLLLTC